MGAFKKIPDNFSFVQKEHEVLSLWEETGAFLASVEQRKTASGDNTYIFYDGPPFATGLPHYGHFIASTIKDVVGRYFTMRGKYVERRFGWDTHGLPIEMLTEKELGLSGPTSIRTFGVGKFNEACRAGVLKYTQEWRRIIGRLGRWVDFDNDYKTMDKNFMESVWWVFQQLWQKGLVYKGFRVMPYSWRLSTPLSNFEANMDYRNVQDPAITVKLRLKECSAETYLLIWTTTPWTLPSNLAVAVGKEIAYVKARKAGESEGPLYVVAKERLEAVLGKEAVVLEEMPGAALAGQTYVPLFDYFAHSSPQAFRVILSDHVTTGDGTGLVHMAPAYGEEDFNACKREGIEIVDPVDEEGKFTSAVTDFAGQNIKEADPQIIRQIKEKGLLFRHDTVQHSYPYCWRSGTPLIYKAMPVWFVNVQKFRDKMVANNEQIHWVPEAVGEKRFGNWLKDAQDWSISRNRFWGTPLPIWECSSCEHHVCLGSAQELGEKTGQTLKDLHAHFVDELTFSCEKCQGMMKRVGGVFDCWFESGSMPYAQIHYPFENQAQFQKGFPAEFIAEGLDQTRGWFYTLLVLSSALFDQPPFKNVIVNGLVLAEDGSKMSKSKQNFPDPLQVLEQYGADALRAYLINSPAVRAEPLLFSENGVREVVRAVLLPLYHAWSFFVQYANIDGFSPEHVASAPAVRERPEIDRWILSKLQSLIREVNEQMEGYYLYRVIPPTMEFIDHLTNWYIRRSRRRFWRNSQEVGALEDKQSAYATLYEVLVQFTKVLSPLCPFLTEVLYQNLVVEPGLAAVHQRSVHLTDYPVADASLIDPVLETSVQVIRQTVSLGRALRESHKLKVRQPLAKLIVVTHDPVEQAALQQHAALLMEELNVKQVMVVEDDGDLCTLSIKPNFKTLGPKAGKNMKAVGAHIAGFTRREFALLQTGKVIVAEGVSVTLEDVMVTRTARGDVVIQSEGSLTVALDTELNSALREEGLARELVSRLQKLRKDKGFEIADRVKVVIQSGSSEFMQAMEAYRTYIAEEVLAVVIELASHAVEAASPCEEWNIEGHQVKVCLSKQN